MTEQHIPEALALIPQLFSDALLQAPLVLRCIGVDKETVGGSPPEAQLFADGSVRLSGVDYPDLEAARVAARPHPDSTATAWQFWSYFDSARGAWAPLEHLRARVVYRTGNATRKNSRSHPLRIDAVSYPTGDGEVGLTLCPGKCSTGLYGGTWARDLAADLTEIARWSPLALISLMEPHEFDTLGLPDFAEQAMQQEYQWLSVPIPDMQVPGPSFERRWVGLTPGLHAGLRAGRSVVIHCRGGLGRSGVVAARILIEAGVSPPEAIAQVRGARLGAIETYAQELYLLNRAWEGSTR
jgi:protein-tyrosine phosphatase